MILHALLIGYALSGSSSDEDTLPAKNCDKKATPSSPVSPNAPADTFKCFSMRGKCDQEKNCVKSKNYPKPHGNNDSCWVTMLAQCQLEVQDPFEVESKNDHLMILNKDREKKEDVPKSLPKGNEFSWITSNTGTKKGWKICMTPSKCVAPTDKTGYEVSEKSLIISTFDVTPLCANTHVGTPKVTPCANHGDPYVLSGCQKKQFCVAPQDKTGYEVAEKDLSLSKFDISVKCASTHEGTAAFKKCEKDGDPYTLSGCTKIPMCTAPANKACYAVTENSLKMKSLDVTAKCADTCVGVAKANTCAADGQAYTLTGCEKKCFRIEGDCDVSNNCVSSKNYPSNYGNKQLCHVVMLEDCALTPNPAFDIELKQDHLKINNKDIEKLTDFPASLPKKNEFMWSTSLNKNHKGWKICFKPTATKDETFLLDDETLLSA